MKNRMAILIPLALAMILCVNAAAQKPQDAASQNEKIKGLNQMLQQAVAARQAGDYPKAVSIMQVASQQDPSRDVLWVSLGLSHLGAKQYPEAIEAFKKAVGLNRES